MQTNTVLYQLFAPKSLLAANGAEDWQMVDIAGSAQEAMNKAAERKLTKFAVCVTVCIGSFNLALQSPPVNAKPI